MENRKHVNTQSVSVNIEEYLESWLPNNMETKLDLQERKQEEQKFILPLTDGLPGRAEKPKYVPNKDIGER